MSLLADPKCMAGSRWAVRGTAPEVRSARGSRDRAYAKRAFKADKIPNG